MKLDRFINRPVLSTVISVLIVILGLIGLATLPITQYPDIAPPTVSVRATYTGANAQTVLNSGYGCRKRTEPCIYGTRSVAGRSNQGRCDDTKETDFHVDGILYL